MNKIPLSATVALLLAAVTPALARGADYPVIRVLSADDSLFVQHQAALEDYYRASKAREPDACPPLSIFEYTRRADEDLFSISARLGLPYDTLATLNGAVGTAAFNARSTILIASQPGLFVNDPPRSSLEDMVLATRVAEGMPPSRLTIIREGRKMPVLFFAGQQFASVERAYFLGILFEFPISRGRVTSLFGTRKDPFTGRPEFHTGVDIGAAEGTDVLAARDGVVEEAGVSDILGTYVLMTHPGGWQTVYGHLSRVRVTIGMSVSAGFVIGNVGHTGRATGPHLHFEVRRKGSVTDPFPLLARRKD